MKQIIEFFYLLGVRCVLNFECFYLRNQVRYMALHFAYQRYKLGLLKGEKVNLFALCANGVYQTQKTFQKLRHDRLLLINPNVLAQGRAAFGAPLGAQG